MTKEQRAGYIQQFLDEHCFAVLLSKGSEYSRGEVDVNSNFKRVGEALGILPSRAAYVYAAKHWDSISSFMKTGQSGTEPIESRLGDLVNYLFIIAALLEEEKGIADVRRT